MEKRDIIKINEEKCTGCGLCVPDCAEGALQIIDGKARLISDLFCDGLGACMGSCPEGAITVEKREAHPYDERRVMEENIVPAGMNTIKKHIEHLMSHNAKTYLDEAIRYLEEKKIPVPDVEKPPCASCPGTRAQHPGKKATGAANGPKGPQASELCNWPLQLHLVNPGAPHLAKADLLLAADCTAFSAGDFHQKFLRGKVLAIACPKLDSGRDIYVKKLKDMIELSGLNTITALIMEVPCCGGLVNIIEEAAEKSSRKIPVKKIVISLEGEIITEEWL
jgi:ferredoxin